MIITRTPFRVSFVGGGTDIRDFYGRHGHGAVVSAAIQQYMYIVIHPYFHDKIRIKYSRTEDVIDLDKIQHPLVRECLKKVGIETGVEIASFADVSSGTGLGSSSAFTVGLLNALYAYKGETISKDRLAEEACEIEIDILKEPIGKQDQYASAFGNINYIRFDRNETVQLSPVSLSESVRAELERRFCLYYVGGKRDARQVLSMQRQNLEADPQKYEYLKKMLSGVDDFYNSLVNGNIDQLGSILKNGWLCKKELADCISNTNIDTIYSKAVQYGATGGKLLGAGGGGFLLICHDKHELLAEQIGRKVLPFNIDTQGTEVILRS